MMYSRFLRLGAATLTLTISTIAVSDEASAQSASNHTKSTVAAPVGSVLSPRQQQIMRIARAGDGYITEELHREFWDAMPFDESQMAEAADVIDELMDTALGPAQALGYESWLSAKMSLEAGRVVRSPGLESAIEATLSASDIDSYRDAAHRSVESVDRILAAAANGTPLATADGPILVNADLIAATLAGIEASARRTEILFNPKWHAPLRHYHYPDVHISTLSPWDFVPETSQLTTPGGRKGNLRSLSRAVAEGQMVSIGFADLSTPDADQQPYWADPMGTAIRNVQASLDAVGAQGRPPYGEDWRGLISATGSGSAGDATGRVYVSVRNVYLPDHKGYLFFIAMSQSSLMDSQKLLDQLEAQSLVLK